MRRGAFVTIEGLEGAGKSSCIATIASALSRHEIPFITTREPGGTELGEGIRDILLASSESPMYPMTELLLMFAARYEHVERVIEPKLNEGCWVICDRFVDSSYAYQGGGRGLELDVIETLEKISLADVSPDYTFVLDVPVNEGLKRAGGVGAPDRFEQENIDFFDRARQVFLLRAKNNPKYCVVDAAKSEEEVQEAIREYLETFVSSFRESR
ncbi:MAG TPA: dTMP kinase [Gammaproteobacteria bacterium]|nr:dTMP kinase [Gammaproteobacteria bacterium]